jgi:hypothetical protein
MFTRTKPKATMWANNICRPRCWAPTSIPPSEQGYEAQVKDRLARWRAAQEKALGLEQTEELPELSEAEVLNIKRRTVRRAESD